MSIASFMLVASLGSAACASDDDLAAVLETRAFIRNRGEQLSADVVRHAGERYEQLMSLGGTCAARGDVSAALAAHLPEISGYVASHREWVDVIRSNYVRPAARPSVTGKPLGVAPKFLQPEYRLIWEYFVLNPDPGEGLDFGILALGEIREPGAMVVLDFVLRLATREGVSAKDVGGIQTNVLTALGMMPGRESLGVILRGIGRWNHRLDDGGDRAPDFEFERVAYDVVADRFGYENAEQWGRAVREYDGELPREAAGLMQRLRDRYAR
jgi:hypothetical protein